MARVNLLTIHWGCSFGGTLQTFATVKTLQDLGHDVKVINLVHPKTKFFHRIKKRHSLPALLYDFNMNLRFFHFQRHHIGHFTRKMYNIHGPYIPPCDFTIVGSDQVWNEDITTPLELTYFLDFVKKGEKIAYASSFGKFHWEGSSSYTKTVKELLGKFKSISVREESAVQICKSVFGVDAIHILDPTLVWGNYDKLLKVQTGSHYIYSFLFKNDEETKTVCNTISRELELSIFKPTKVQSFTDASPRGWLNRMRNADFIITDSFHGLAFSIIFHKNFIVLCADKKKFARLLSLLKLVHLEDRFVSSLKDLLSRINLLKENINYSEVDKILLKERQKALSFLTESLH